MLSHKSTCSNPKAIKHDKIIKLIRIHKDIMNKQIKTIHEHNEKFLKDVARTFLDSYDEEEFPKETNGNDKNFTHG